MNESYNFPRIKQFYAILKSDVTNLFELLGCRRMHFHKYYDKNSRTITTAVFFSLKITEKLRYYEFQVIFF